MENMVNLNTANSAPEFMKINTRDLLPHPIAQREFLPEWAHQIAKNFKWEKYKPVDVSYHNGKYYIIDGQHRVSGIRQHFGKDCVIMCRVHYGMTELDEANFFLEQDKGRKHISRIDQMWVRYKIGDEVITDMVRIATKVGFIVDGKSNNSKYKIAAVGTLEKVYKYLSREQFFDMLSVIKKAWDGHPDSIGREMLLGMAVFYKAYWGMFDSKALVRALSKILPDVIIRDGRSVSAAYGALNGGGNYAISRRALPYARSILRCYNNVRRGSYRLEDRF